MLAREIKDLLENEKPKSLCGKCIAKAIGRKAGSQIGATLAAFGLTSDFARYPGHCAGCGEQAWVIKAGGTE